eukprot:CAMPEP_0176172712 /NCGR_PEP_ID=MMETSP0120_2-20121206/88490_1 /TAXON_ID=160619 /ORGANISM="Kryptoperidinium foliaceum, Strain CCMP 1326" /LENGTH=318 /DNA_ID=CAMNT_0017510713 /DNA_START=8 /DNA_END=963 /DNA_ORIENTATION=+
MTSDELMEIMKGLRSYSSDESKAEPDKGLPDPCVYFNTDVTTRESETELSRWREGKYVAVKFLDTHKDQGNIDVGFLGLMATSGGTRSSKAGTIRALDAAHGAPDQGAPQAVEEHVLEQRLGGDGRDFTGGCRSGQTDFHQTSVYTVTFRCSTNAIDLCEACAYDPALGRVTDTSVESDLEALMDPSMCKLAVTRLRNQWRRNWPDTLPKYFAGGLLDSLLQALQKTTETVNRPDEERPRQQSGAENQKRQVRRLLLQFTMELTQRLLGIGPGGDINGNDLVWALCHDPDEHWDEGRVLQLPKADAASRASPAAAAAT